MPRQGGGLGVSPKFLNPGGEVAAADQYGVP